MDNQSAGPFPAQTNQKERAIIVSTFKDNDSLLKNLRALFLNLGLNPEEKGKIKALPSEVKQIIRDRLYPVMDKETQIGMVKDAWLGVENMVFSQTPSTIKQAIEYKVLALKMTKVAMNLLDDPDGMAVDIEYHEQPDELGINLLARNQFIRHIEGQLYSLWIIANQVEETPNQATKRQKKDSSQ